jgi:hypothetical protein
VATDGSQWVSAVATITSGLVAAIVAIGVTWLGHVFAARREADKAKADALAARKAFLRSKVEEVVSLITEHVQAKDARAMYIGVLGAYSAQGREAPAEAEPPDSNAEDRAEAIQVLYFPELADQMAAVGAANLVQGKFLTEELARFRADVRAWGAESANTFGTRAAQAAGPLHEAWKNLALAARRLIEDHYAP